MKLLRTLLLVIAVAFTTLGISGCPSNPTTSQPAFDRAAAQRDVFAAKEGYGIAEKVATTYARLPRCATPAIQPCSDVAVLAQITKARNIARDALGAAQSAVDNPAFGSDVITSAVTAAQAAMGAYSKITTQYGGN